jgi:hypothetical protein
MQFRGTGVRLEDVRDIVEDSRDSCGVSKSVPSLVAEGDGNVNERSESSASNSIFGMVDLSRSLI